MNDICLKMVYSDPDSALFFGKEALAIGIEENDDEIIGKSYNRIGIVYDVENIWDTALVFYDSALFYAERAKDSITIASAYNNIGLVYWNKSYYDKAVENFFVSLKIFEKLGIRRGVANIYNNIGLILMEQKRDSAALDYQFRGLRIREEIGDAFGINDSRLNIALLYWSTKVYDSSAIYYKRAIPFYLNTKNHYALGTAYNGLAMVFDSEKKYDSALIYFDKAISEHLQVQNYYKAASSLLNKAATYRDMNLQPKELETLLKAKDLVKEESSNRVRSKILFQLAQIYYELGQYKEASKLYLEHKVISDSLYDVNRDEKIEQIKVQYETERREKELLREKAENERLAKEKALAEIRVYNRNKWIIGISSVSAILILVVLFMNQRKKRKIQSEKDAAIIDEREKGIKAVFDAQEEERQRIAKDLHDGVGQQISAIKIHLQTISKNILEKTKEFEPELNKIDKMVTDTGTEIRSISHQMMPRALTELGLVAALEDMIEKSFTYSGMECTFEHHGLKERLPSNVEIGLYRIAQELVNNIIKHAGAKKVDVQLMKTNLHCILVVQDDGQGFGQTGKAKGIGMMNINNRLRTINGELNMESDEGHGTTATIRIALQKNG
ncbi:MAG: tetratricopeptide repeat protein [Bacteroidales bacterium]|nr:tetratricopeptide repeat protein [Bacteroidales bacterium]